jgi:hypothetical protein
MDHSLPSRRELRHRPGGHLRQVEHPGVGIPPVGAADVGQEAPVGGEGEIPQLARIVHQEPHLTGGHLQEMEALEHVGIVHQGAGGDGEDHAAPVGGPRHLEHAPRKLELPDGPGASSQRKSPVWLQSSSTTACLKPASLAAARSSGAGRAAVKATAPPPGRHRYWLMPRGARKTAAGAHLRWERGHRAGVPGSPSLLSRKVMRVPRGSQATPPMLLRPAANGRSAPASSRR